MFQNIGEAVLESEKKEIPNKWAQVFTPSNIVIYIITFMLSLVGVGGNFSVFSISMLAACFATSVPLLGIVVVSILGNIIEFGVNGAVEYFLTALVLIVTIFILKPKYNEQERNEKLKVGKNIFIATLIVQLAKFAISSFTLYDVLFSITYSILAVVFYKIFVNSIPVFDELKNKKAFSIEEVIGTSLVIAIAVSCFGDFKILGFSITNVLSILIVLILGWKNGILVGATSGITIGITLGIISGSEPIMIAAYAISGMLAGLLNRFGKIGVIVGFCIGNIVLAYVSNGYTVELIHFKEILIASIALLAVPKNISINIEEFVGSSKLLPLSKDRTLTRSQETVEKLNNMSDTIKKLADTYQKEQTTLQDEILKEDNKQVFITELLNNIEPYKENLLYDDIANVNGKIINDIFNLLLDKQEISREELLKIFADCNSYIIGFDDKEVSKYLEENIMQMLRAINISYKISKSNFIWKKRLDENKKNMQNQLNGVSKAISGMAKEIEKEAKIDTEYEKQEIEIIEKLKQKEIQIEEISIKHPNRYLIEIYTHQIVDNRIIEEVLTKVLNEKIVINEENSVGNRLSFMSDDKFVMGLGTAEYYKSQNLISGDNMLNIRLKDGKYLVALSDGMGTGKKANESSSQALKMLENLLLSGFDKETSLELISTSLINNNEEMFATLDIAIVDLYQGNIEFIKSGACPTYIKNKKKVQIIKSTSLPTGMMNEKNIESFDSDIQNGEIVLMCSDGVLDANIEYKNKELWIKYMLEDIETTNTKKIADIIINEAVDNNFGKAKDDMSIIVLKFMEK